MFSTIQRQSPQAKLGALAMTGGSSVTAPFHAGGVLRRFKAWQARRAMAAELYAMSDRDLRDIGLSRAEIPAVLQMVR
jgi:uncharacterized protein YjiS (DUF1127 family)